MRGWTTELAKQRRTLALAAAGALAAWSLMPDAVIAEPGGTAAVRLAAPTMAVPAAVFGTDDRVPLPPRLQPLRERMGVLFNIRQRTVCSAFCIEPNLIGTAAHCLFKTAGEKSPKLSDFWFARNYDAVRDYARVAGHDRGSAAQNVIAGSFGVSTVPPIDATKDWAFVRLSRPVCTKGVLEVMPLPVEKLIEASKAGRVFQISYHKDYKQWQPAYSKPCSVERTFAGVAWATIAADFAGAEDLLLHTCDTGGASSGSPLLMETAQGPRVVGINVGTYVQSRTLVHAGDKLEKPVTDAVANTGVAASAFGRQLAAFRAAQILANPIGLREMQERLQQGGYYAGPIDGTYGPALKHAIDAFESASRLPLTGLASEDVLSRLRLGAGTALPVR